MKSTFFTSAQRVRFFFSTLLVFSFLLTKAQPDTQVKRQADGSTITTTTETINGDIRTVRVYRNSNGKRTRMVGSIQYNGAGTNRQRGRDAIEINFDANGDSLFSRRLIYDSENNLVQRRVKRFNEGRRIFDEHEWLNADGTRRKLQVYDPATGGYETYPKEEYNNMIEATWSKTSRSLNGAIGKRFTLHFPPGNPGVVWGTNVYTDDSSIGGAAVHAGLISKTSGGIVTIEIRTGQSSYTGSVRNGVATQNWGTWGGSFVFVR
jgi:hypothetical protein